MGRKVHNRSRGLMATAIAITVAMTALAQDSHRLRTSRTSFEGAIKQRFKASDLVEGGALVEPNRAQGPGPGPIGPWERGDVPHGSADGSPGAAGKAPHHIGWLN